MLGIYYVLLMEITTNYCYYNEFISMSKFFFQKMCHISQFLIFVDEKRTSHCTNVQLRSTILDVVLKLDLSLEFTNDAF